MKSFIKEEAEEPRNCPFCNTPPSKGKSLYTMLSKFVYWCGNKECILGKSEVKFWFKEWQNEEIL